MTSPPETAERIRALLEARFAPLELVVRDDSAAHAGHAGARSGGHFHVRIVTPAFSGLPLVRRLLPGCLIARADSADALAVAICHAHHRATQQAWLKPAAGIGR